MAITVRKDPDATKLPGLTVRSYEVDFDTSYATGGMPWDLSADFDVVKAVVFESKAGYGFELTSKDAPASSKIKVYDKGTHTHTENTNATYAQNATTAASTAAALVEVANAVNLSTVTKVGVIVIGKKS